MRHMKDKKKKSCLTHELNPKFVRCSIGGQIVNRVNRDEEREREGEKDRQEKKLLMQSKSNCIQLKSSQNFFFIVWLAIVR